MTPYVDGRYVAERRYNPLIRSPAGGRILSALQLPWFTLVPPRGYGVLTTTGRRTGKRRHKCVRAIRRGSRVYMVSIPGPVAAWIKNVRANPRVTLRLHDGTHRGAMRELGREDAEIAEARLAFCDTVLRFDFMACGLHRRGRPTRPKVDELLRTWFEGGIPLVVELDE